VLACLQSFLGTGGGASRTLRETLLRSLGVHIIALGSYGHLMSLQGFASANSSRTCALLVVFFLFPELAMAQLLSRIATALAQVIWKRRVYARYWIASILGSHVLAYSKPVPLGHLNADQLRSERQKYSLVWVGRCAVLVLLLVQYTCSLGIWFRILFVWDRHNMDGHIHARNFHMAFGGMVAVVNSIALAWLNLQWRHVPDDITPAPNSLQVVHELTAGIGQPNLSDAEMYPPAMVIQPEGCSSSKMALPQRLILYNTSFGCWLDKWFPEVTHHDIEGAMTAHILVTYFTSIVCTFRTSWNPLRLTKLILSKSPQALQNSEHIGDIHGGIFNTAGYTALFRASLHRDTVYYKLFTVIEYLIIVCVSTRLLARNVLSKKYTPRVKELCMFCDKWITGGRSLLSFPWFAFFVSFHVWDTVGSFVRAVQVDKAVAEVMEKGTHWDRLHLGSYLYKDPWYESMYIL
jgi:hypothetical protein